MLRRLLPLGSLLLVVVPLWAAENEIGFGERFALAADRERALEQLVPGSDDYFYYHALHYQTTEQKPKLQAILQQWAARNPHSPQLRVMQNREALLNFDTDPAGSTALLKERLHLRLDHAPETPENEPEYPAVLDPQRVSWEAFREKALREHPDNVDQFQPRGLAELVRSRVQLTVGQRRALLRRISEPDIPFLLELVEMDLRSKESAGFGEYPIHAALLPEQLDALAQRLPVLWETEAFVRARLQKLRPSADVDARFDLGERAAWLDRLWAIAKNLGPSFDSLKANILFRRLELDRMQGRYDRARFLEYVKLPRRNSPLVSPAYLRRFAPVETVDFSASFEDLLPGGPIHDDSWLIREYLLRFFAEDAGWETYAPYLRDTYLKPLFAEAKLAAGVGAPERWASLINPSALQALKERVDLAWSPTNAQLFAPAAEVSLGVAVKNAPQLLVRIYELNALTFFLTQNRQLNTDLNLDGLVANTEKTLEFDDAAARNPFRRELRNIALPELSGRRGAWIVEVIGGGKSSRALVRKGQYDLLHEAGPAGDLLTVVDESGAVVRDAVVWLEGRRYAPDAKLGRINIPFTQAQGEKPIILASPSGDFATLTTFLHSAEAYRLDAQFQLPREQLLAGQQAALAIRAALLQADTPLSLELLEEPRLRIESHLMGGITSTREITPAEGLKFSPDKLFTTTLQVPERLQSLTVTLTAKVPKLSQGGEKAELSASATWTLNGIAMADAAFAAHLTRTPQGFALELRGRNGEAIRRSPVRLYLAHAGFALPIEATLRSDEGGRVQLGALPEIVSLRAELAGGKQQQWTLPSDGAKRPAQIQLAAGEPLVVPWPHPGLLRHEDVSLLEWRGSTAVADRFPALKVQDGALRAENLPPGDYRLEIHAPGDEQAIFVRITAGKPADGWLYSPVRSLERWGAPAVRIASVREEGEALVVQLADANAGARLHVLTGRYVPGEEWRPEEHLAGFELGSPLARVPGRQPNLFLSGRNLGDEYRYILERRYMKPFPGNMLPRPGLLLSPWEVRSTDVAAQEMQAGEAPAAVPGNMAGKAKRAEPSAPADMSTSEKAEAVRAGFLQPDLDFLSTAGPVLWNLVPDAQGQIRIERRALGDRHLVELYAEDLHGASWQYLTLPATPAALRERRLTAPLDPQKAFVQRQQVTPLATGAPWSTPTQTEARLYDSLSRVFSLYRTLAGPEEKLVEFEFLLRWPQLSEEEKRAKYSQYASHEVNLFLSRKDPAFFRAVIVPFLQNKKERTFLDDYLLGADLSRYLAPWSYDQLNSAERALLAQRVAGERESIARQLRESWDLQRPDPERERRAFDLALHGEEAAEPAGLAIAAAAAPMPVPRLMTKEAESGAIVPQAQVAGRKALSAGFAERGALAFDVAQARRLREEVRPFYRKIGPTKEWAENNYYHRLLTPAEMAAGVPIPLSPFWRDLAEWDGKGPFLSPHFHELHGTRAELLCALAVLDLPFAAEPHQSRTEGERYTLTTGSPLLAVHQEIVPAEAAQGAAVVALSENFFRADDRYREEGNERVDKFVTGEFLAGVIYGGRVAISNSTSSPISVDLLLQVPEGAIPVAGSLSTDSRRRRLEGNGVTLQEYYFYFPAARPQPFAHHPAQVSRQGQLIASTVPRTFQVVTRLSQVDENSWEHLSQYGTDAQVLAYLESHSLPRTDLTRVAWRAKARPAFLRQLTQLLQKRHYYSDVIYAYGLLHREPAILRELLRHHDDFVDQCGPWLKSPLLTVDPIERHTYQQLEYAPLINQRAHRLGPEYRIPNGALRGQYQQLLGILACKPALEPMDRLSVTYYLFLQDRVEEALAQLQQVRPESVPTRLQYDYLRCYAAFYQGDLAAARAIAGQYAKYGVERWRRLFQGVLAQLEEIEGRQAPEAKPVPGTDGTQRELDQAKLAGSEPSFDFQIEKGQITLNWNALAEVTVNYYLMDPEFLFSTSPFATDDPARFAIVRPAFSQKQPLPPGESHLELPLPEKFQHANLVIEILGGGQRKVQPHHANTLRLNVVQNYGRLEARDAATGKALPRAYVKVYARLMNGTVRFYKDGYTDLRGIFDYSSLNAGLGGGGPIPLDPAPAATGAPANIQMLRPDEVGAVEKLAILVLTEQNGSATREVAPPSE